MPLTFQWNFCGCVADIHVQSKAFWNVGCSSTVSISEQAVAYFVLSLGDGVVFPVRAQHQSNLYNSMGSTHNRSDDFKVVPLEPPEQESVVQVV